jgi:hypothetical protein
LYFLACMAVVAPAAPQPIIAIRSVILDISVSQEIFGKKPNIQCLGAIVF